MGDSTPSAEGRGNGGEPGLTRKHLPILSALSADRQATGTEPPRWDGKAPYKCPLNFFSFHAS